MFLSIVGSVYVKNTVNVVMVLVGTFIGAGFASGREIWQYFGIFGKFDIFGIVISCILLSAFTYCTVYNIVLLGCNNYVRELCKFRWVNWLLNAYMVLMLCTMITAFGETLNQSFGFPKIAGVLLMDVVTMTILYFGAKGIVKLNIIVTPLIIAGIVFVLFANNIKEVFSYNNFVTSSVIYTSYNVISLPFVMLGMKKSFSDKKQMLLCSVLFGTVICILAFCVLEILKFSDVSLSIPLLSSVKGNFNYLFIGVVAMAMLTTAVSNGYGFVNGGGFAKNSAIVFLGVIAVLFSFFSFNFVIKYLYSLFGYMGLYIFLKNFYIFLKNREKKSKSKINVLKITINSNKRL